jgi:hypothetical protein
MSRIAKGPSARCSQLALARIAKGGGLGLLLSSSGHRDENFSTEVLTDEVVVGHRGDGHIFRFPILANGTITLHGSLIEPNPKAKREARRYLTEAYNAAKEALRHSAG